MIALLFAIAACLGRSRAVFDNNITVYHEYAPKYESLGLRDQDTGDLNGDAYFVLRSLLLPIECTSGDPASRFDCANPEENGTSTNVVSEHIVGVNSDYGEYGRCNIENGKYSCLPSEPQVGRADVSTRYNDRTPKPTDENWKWWRVNIARKIGGFWYSTTSAGDCSLHPAAQCYWKLIETTSRISSHCLVSHLRSAIESYSPDCFETCEQPLNVTGTCAAKCYMDTLLSPKGQNALVGPSDGIPNAVIEKAWKNAFSKTKAGCPQV